jgi:hypothetical protein
MVVNVWAVVLVVAALVANTVRATKRAADTVVVKI